MYIPKDFGTVTPYIFAENAETFVEFLKAAFGGEELGRHLRSDGKIANAQVRIGNSTLMISETEGRKYQARPGSYYIYVDDAEASMKRALSAGAKLEMKVADMPYGDRQGGVVDSHGNFWWISQRLVDEPYYS